MSWADEAIEKLQQGERAQVRQSGISMAGKVNDGDIVTLEPCNPKKLAVGDIVLVKVKGYVYLHLIKDMNNGRCLIGNNRGGTNGWVGTNSIYGKAIKIKSG